MAFIYPASPWGGIRTVRIDDPLTPEQIKTIKSEPEWYLELRSSNPKALKSLESVIQKFSAITINLENQIPFNIWDSISHVRFISLNFETKLGSLDFSKFNSLQKIRIDACDVSTDKLFSSKSYSSISVTDSSILKGLDLSELPNIENLHTESIKKCDSPKNWNLQALLKFRMSNYRGHDFFMPDFLGNVVKLDIALSRINWADQFPVAPELEELHLSGCGKIPDLGNLGRSSKLKFLHIESKDAITGIESIQKCKDLSRMSISGGGFINPDLSWFKRMRNLEFLAYYDRDHYKPRQAELYEQIGLLPSGSKFTELIGRNFDKMNKSRIWDD